MKKVYCKNCKFEGKYDLSPQEILSRMEVNFITCLPKDRSSNCADYKRKWWKFWIK